MDSDRKITETPTVEAFKNAQGFTVHQKLQVRVVAGNSYSGPNPPSQLPPHSQEQTPSVNTSFFDGSSRFNLKGDVVLTTVHGNDVVDTGPPSNVDQASPSEYIIFFDILSIATASMI
jgi:hypothetical protein